MCEQLEELGAVDSSPFAFDMANSAIIARSYAVEAASIRARESGVASRALTVGEVEELDALQTDLADAGQGSSAVEFRSALEAFETRAFELISETNNLDALSDYTSFSFDSLMAFAVASSRATVSGHVYLDANLDGASGGDAGIADLTVFADLNRNGSYDEAPVYNFEDANSLDGGGYILSDLEVKGFSGDVRDVQLTVSIADFRDGGAALYSPDGTFVDLFSNVGNVSELDRVTFSDDGVQLVSDATEFVNVTVRPESPLDIFVGNPGGGVWTLLFYANDGQAIDPDTIQWSLAITGDAEPRETTDSGGRFELPGLAPQQSFDLRVTLPDGFGAMIGGVDHIPITAWAGESRDQLEFGLARRNTEGITLQGRGTVNDYVDIPTRNVPIVVGAVELTSGELLSRGVQHGDVVRLSLAGLPSGDYEVVVAGNVEAAEVVRGDKFGEATGEPEIAALDLDGTEGFQFANDGILLLAYAFGNRGGALEPYRGGGEPRSGAEIESVVSRIESALDLDGDGEFRFSSDGVILLAHAFGARGEALEQFRGAGATRAGTSINTRIEGLLAKAGGREQSPERSSASGSNIVSFYFGDQELNAWQGVRGLSPHGIGETERTDKATDSEAPEYEFGAWIAELVTDISSESSRLSLDTFFESVEDLAEITVEI